MHFWPVIYLAITAAAAITPFTLEPVGHNIDLDSGLFHALVFIGMPLQATWLGIVTYRSLVRRTVGDYLQARIWHSPPTNPQSNQLAQILAFGSFGVSTVCQHTNTGLRLFGFLGVWVSAGLLASLLLFRARHIHSSRRHEI